MPVGYSPVALRIIADREEEINAFIPEEYWSLDAVFKIPGEKKPLVAKFYGKEKEKMTISSREEADRIMEELKGVSYQVSEVKREERGKKDSASIYYQHFAAGSFQGTELFYPEDNASGSAAV